MQMKFVLRFFAFSQPGKSTTPRYGSQASFSLCFKRKGKCAVDIVTCVQGTCTTHSCLTLTLLPTWLHFYLFLALTLDRNWLFNQNRLIPFVVYTFCSLINDHRSDELTNLREQEISLCSRLWKEKVGCHAVRCWWDLIITCSFRAVRVWAEMEFECYRA